MKKKSSAILMSALQCKDIPIIQNECRIKAYLILEIAHNDLHKPKLKSLFLKCYIATKLIYLHPGDHIKFYNNFKYQGYILTINN